MKVAKSSVKFPASDGRTSSAEVELRLGDPLRTSKSLPVDAGTEDKKQKDVFASIFKQQLQIMVSYLHLDSLGLTADRRPVQFLKNGKNFECTIPFIALCTDVDMYRGISHGIGRSNWA